MSKLYYYLGIIAIFLLNIAKIHAQENIDILRYSAFEGRHFYVGFMKNEISGSSNLRLFIAATKDANVTIKSPNEPVGKYFIQAGKVRETDINTFLERHESEVADKNLIEVTSDVPIVCYAFNSQLTTSESCSILPISRWGKSYVIMSYPNDQYDDPLNSNLDSADRFIPRKSQFMVVAAYDSTTIKFRPRSVTYKGKQIYQDYTVVLNAGETYFVQSFDAARLSGDLTGTVVTSDKPVGVYSGHQRTSVLQTNRAPFDSKDHLVEMLPPSDTWGKNYLSVPYDLNPDGDLFRVACIEPGTSIIVQYPSGTQSFYLNSPGDFATVTGIWEGAVWKADKPVQICQYMMRSGRSFESENYDPSFVVLPPIEQYVESINFLTPRNYNIPDQYKVHSAVFIYEEKAIQTMTLDGIDITQNLTLKSGSIAGTTYRWGKVDISEAAHKLVSKTGRFAGILYGCGYKDSYAMILGNALSNPFKIDSLSPRIIAEDNCGTINGLVFDALDTNASGLDYGFVVKESLVNYNTNIEQISDTATYIKFSAVPQNKFNDGFVEFDFYDKNSNAVKYQFDYKGYKLDYPNKITFSDVNWNLQDCHKFTIKNTSRRVMFLDSVKFTRDKRLAYTSNKTLPQILKQGDEIEFEICFTPGGDSAALSSNFKFFFDCNIEFTTNITGKVNAPNLEAKGFDFGIVRIGDTVCTNVYIQNNGNKDIRIDSLDFDNISHAVKIDTVGRMPFLIKPNEKIFFNACFSPDTLGFYMSSAFAKNSFDISSKIIITGIGGAPKFESLVLDWGLVRIGLKKDSVINIKNNGNYKAIVSYVKTNYDNTLDNDINNVKFINNIEILPGDSFPVNFTFNSIDTTLKELSADMKLDWNKHPDFTIIEQGRGSIPVITTRDFIFDTTRIFSERDSVMALIFPDGNEILSIDSIYLIKGDIASFEIDFNLLKNLKLSKNELFTIPAKFKPIVLGRHEILVGIVHDANPSYLRSIDTVSISGIAIPVDTIRNEITILMPDLPVCVSGEGSFKLKNVGNINSKINSIEIDPIPNTFTAQWLTDVSSILPINIIPGDSLVLFLKVYSERNKGGIVRITSVINDSITQVHEFDRKPMAPSLELSTADHLNAAPGDTIIVGITGKIPSSNEVKTKLIFKFKYDRYLLYLTADKSTMRVTDANGDREIEVGLLKNLDEIEIILPNDFEYKEYAEFFIQLPFLALLTNYRDGELIVDLNSDRCFDPVEKKIIYEMDEVCSFPLRPIKLISNLPIIDISPNPVINYLNLMMIMPEKDIVSITATDILGKTYEMGLNLSLEKGRHDLKLDVSGIPSGAYRLCILTTNSKNNITFIITK